MIQTIQVSLPSSTLYVSGTVNGVATDWTNTSGSIWQTIADRATNEIYRVELTMVSISGIATTKSITMYYGLLNLITDRTQADVDYVARQAEKWRNGTLTDDGKEEFLSGLKGAYNATDLNRVNAAVQFVNEYLNSLQEEINKSIEENGISSDSFWIVVFDPLVLMVKQDWEVADLPTESDFDQYLDNVDKLTSQIPIEKNLPATMDRLTVEGANEIERAIRAEYEAGKEFEAYMKQLIVNTALGFVQSGEIFGGEL